MGKKKINGNEPATQADLALWGGALTKRMDGIEERIDQVDRKFTAKFDGLQGEVNGLKRTVGAVLEIVQVIDRRTRDWEDIPGRMTRVEEEVVKLKQRR